MVASAPAADVLRHVLAHSCAVCAHSDRDGKAKGQGCGYYYVCKAGKPLTATPHTFVRKGA